MCVLLVCTVLVLAGTTAGDPTGPESLHAEVTELPRSLTPTQIQALRASAESPRSLTPVQIQALRASNDFGLKLLRQLRGRTHQRIVYQPGAK